MSEGNATQAITINDLKISPQETPNCWEVDCNDPNAWKATGIRVGPGRYDEHVFLVGQHDGPQFQYEERPPWYAGAESLILPLILAVFFFLAWAAQEMNLEKRPHD